VCRQSPLNTSAWRSEGYRFVKQFVHETFSDERVHGGPGVMIHYTCDCCKQRIDTVDELRYIVRLEVYAALEPLEEEAEDDRDHLQEIQDALERLDKSSEEVCSEVYHKRRFDLCNACRQQFVQNPLGKPLAAKLNFSQN